MKNTGLSVNNKIVLISTFGVLILGIVLQLGIAQWNKPDVRYEEGSYYHTGNFSITSLRLSNYGHSDAENITVSVYFPLKIKDIASGDPAVKITILSGGADEQFVVFSIPRIVPSQTVFIYFATDRIGNTGVMANQEFVSSITYNGDVGRTGLPIYLDAKISFISMIIFTVVALIISLIFMLYVKRKIAEFKRENDLISNQLDNIEKTMELIDQEILDAKQSGIKLPEIVDEAQRKVKITMYGSEAQKRSKSR